MPDAEGAVVVPLPQHIDVELWSHASNSAILRLPTRRFPGSFIQGDSLYNLFVAAREMVMRLYPTSDQMLSDTAEELFRSLYARLLHYDRVLETYGHERPYAAINWGDVALGTYTWARHLIQQHPDTWSFTGAPTEAAVLQAEATLSIRFPLPYRHFLRDYGGGRIGSLVLFGLTNATQAPHGATDLVQRTLAARQAGTLPAHLLPIAGDHTGVYTCLNLTAMTNPAAPAPVVIADPNTVPHAPLEYSCEDFGLYLLDALRDALDAG
jgi:hypothetical protein